MNVRLTFGSVTVFGINQLQYDHKMRNHQPSIHLHRVAAIICALHFRCIRNSNGESGKVTPSAK